MWRWHNGVSLGHDVRHSTSSVCYKCVYCTLLSAIRTIALSNCYAQCFTHMIGPITACSALCGPCSQFYTNEITKYCDISLFVCLQKDANPGKNLSSQLTHWELTLKLTTDYIWGHSVTSQWTNKMRSHCELSVSYLWYQPMSSQYSSNSELTVSWSPVSSPC